jgi:hypothetical protein
MKFSQSQEILWSHVAPKLDRHEKLWFVVLKSRQVYSSTFFAALTFVRTLEKPGTSSLVLAHDLFTSHDIFDKVKTFEAHLPLPKLRSPRQNELIFPFPGGVSRYRVISAGSVAKGRGTTQSAMLLSEIPSWPHPEIATGLFQAMPDLPDTILVEESTARGISGPGRLFYEEWIRAVDRESDMESIFIPWFAMKKYRRKPPIMMDDWDDREKLLVATYGGPNGLEPSPDQSRGINAEACGEQLSWRRYAIKVKCQNSIDNFDQEYPESPAVAFIASGQPAFERMELRKQEANVKDPVCRISLESGKLIERSQGELRVWQKPLTGHDYVIGADTAEGLGGRDSDYAAAEILDCKTLEQVASIHGRIPPYEFACLLNAAGIYYNKALLNIEVYPHGHRVQDHLIREFMYPNLHRWRGKPDRIRVGPARIYGWETNVWSRPLMIGAGQRAFNNNLVTIRESGLLNELMHFSKNDEGKYEAEVEHDDRVMAILLALRSREEHWIERHVGPAVSEPDPLKGIRVMDAGHYHHTMDADGRITSVADTRRKLSKILREKANAAVQHWMSY